MLPCTAIGQDADHRKVTIEIRTTGEAPEWAIWQRRLLTDSALAAREFVDRYTRPDGTIIWRDEWPGP